MKNKILLTAVLLSTLGNMEISAMEQGVLSPASKAYQRSRELEEQKRQSIREKIKASRLENQQSFQTIESEKVKAEAKAREEALLRKQKEDELANETEAKTRALEKAKTEAVEKNRLAIINFLNNELANHAEIIIMDKRAEIDTNINQAIENIAGDTTAKYKDQDIETEASWILNESERAALESQRKIRKVHREVSLDGIEIEELEIFKEKLETEYSEFFGTQKNAIAESALTLFMEKLNWESIEVGTIEQMLRNALAEYGVEETQVPQDIKGEDLTHPESEDSLDLAAELS